MKKVIIIALLLFFACKTPSKLVDSSNTNIKDKTQLNIEEKHEAKEQTTTTTKAETDEQSTIVEEIKLTEYDTDKPVNPDTGKPPVKYESETKKTTTKGKQVAEQSNTTTDIADINQLKDNSKINVETNTITKHEETPQKPKIAYYYYIILIVVILGSVWWINKKLGILKI